MSLTRNNKILLAVIVAAAAVAAYWFVLLAPEREQAAKLETEIAAKQVELQQATTQLAAYEKARGSYEKNYATLARLGKAVPADDDVRSMMVQLDSAAQRSGVDFLKIEVGTGATAATPTDAAESDDPELASAPGTIEVGAGFSAMPFTFAFDGSFFELSEFFARLERFVTVQNDDIGVTGRLLRLESVQIQPAEAGFPLMQAEIGAATYLVPPLQGVEETPAATGEGTTQASTAPGATPSTTTATATGATP